MIKEDCRIEDAMAYYCSIGGCGDGSFEWYCEKLLEEIGYDEVWVRFDSREDVFDDVDWFDIAELVKLIGG